VTPTPSVLWAVRHFFSLRRRSAVRWMPKDDFAHVDELVHRWSPKWDVPPGETDAVKAIFRNPANLNAALGYYRALRPWPPSSHRLKIRVPTVSFAGDSDLVPATVYERARSQFTGPYEVVQMPGGHFMHREHPTVFNEKLVAVLERSRRA
jgi:pimeloyl-ACP methyl ester carboxylesterase